MTLSAVAVYFGYTIVQIRGLRDLQANIIDRNRTDSLLLLRIQNNLNSLGLAMRDMLDSSEPYPLTAWQSQFHRIRIDLEDAVEREARISPATRTSDQARYLTSQMSQFWDALDRIFALAEHDEAGSAGAHPALAAGAPGRAEYRRGALLVKTMRARNRPPRRCSRFMRGWNGTCTFFWPRC